MLFIYFLIEIDFLDTHSYVLPATRNVHLSIHSQLIAVIAVAPTDRASFVYSYVQTRLRGQYNGK